MSSQAVVVDLPFVEQDTAIAPSDRAGGLDDLVARSPLSLPEVVRTDRWIGRAFGDGVGLVGEEKTPGQARLDRDLTIEAACRIDVERMSGEAVVCAGSVEGRVLWGLQLVPRIRNIVTMQLVWQMAGGDWATVPGASFPVNGDHPCHLSATRRWLSPNEVDVAYGVNGQTLGGGTSTDGGIEARGDGIVTIGCRGVGAGGYESFFHGVIESIRASRVARSAEELRQAYRGHTEHPRVAYTALQKLMPVGDQVYATDPDSIIQRELRVEGAALAKVRAKTAELRDDYYPDTAWSKLPDWERVTGQLPAPSERFETRRNRVLSFLRTQHGFSTEKVKHALEPTFDLTASQIELLEYTNHYKDTFDGGLAAFWAVHPGNGSTGVTPEGLRIHVPTGVDLRWESSQACLLRHSVGGDFRDPDPAGGLDITTGIAADQTSSGIIAGLFAYDGITRDLCFFGVLQLVTERVLVWLEYRNHTWLDSRIVSMPADEERPLWLRARYDGDGQWALFHSTSGPADTRYPFRTTGVHNPAWVGLGLLSATHETVDDTNVTFSGWRAFIPNGVRPYHWYAYRDPALPGEPDMRGADKVVRRLKPAHTHAAAIAERAVACDDSAAGGCDGGPLGT